MGTWDEIIGAIKGVSYEIVAADDFTARSETSSEGRMSIIYASIDYPDDNARAIETLFL